MYRRLRDLRGLVLALAAGLLLAACARDADDWRAASSADTPESYEAFLRKHPQSAFAGQARTRAQELVEKGDWDVATGADTPDSYRSFLQKHPDGVWAQEARVRIANFELAEPSAPAVAAAPTAAPPLAPAPPPAAAPKAPPAAAPKAPSAAAPPARPGAARVQLGAFSARSKAETEWARLRARFAQLQGLEPDYVEAQTPVGRVFRLQAGVPAGTDARAFCEALKSAGQACIVVPAP